MFNLQGFNCGQPILYRLIANNDIICVQEYWLYNCNMGLLFINNNFNMVFSSAWDDYVINYGHPFRGTTILWRNDLFTVQSYK